jgi:gluconolactonase
MFLTLVVALLAAEPTSQQVELLKAFRQEFVAITPGEGKFPQSFVLGNDQSDDTRQQPAVKITFDYPFAMAKYEVPQNLWEAVMGSNPSRWKGARNSVEMFSFEEAEAFCWKATELMRQAKLIKPTEVIRLPSEAEWEYSARAGTTTRYSFGDDAKLVDQYGWHNENAAGNDPPVGAKKPNPWGLYDVHGYLAEFCTDRWNESHEGVPTNGGPLAEKGQARRRVLKGGSWKTPRNLLESAARMPIDLDKKDDAVGLRCVLAAEGAGAARPTADGDPCGAELTVALVLAASEFAPTAQEKIVPAASKLESLWNEGEFTEGPALAPDRSIIFSDIGNAMYRYDPATGKTAVFRQPSGRSNGLMFSHQGALVACEGANTGGGRRISITTGIVGAKDGTVKTLADRYEGKRFNSPNDLAIDTAGNVYFTDPRYVGDDPRDLDFECVFFVTPAGQVSIATRDVQKPNGILVSPDGKSLYVADNNPQGNRHLAVFAIDSPGKLGEKRVLHDFDGGRGIDGMTLDAAGNIYATAGTGDKAGIYVFSPSGEHLAMIPTPGDPTNCCFGGGEDGQTLYITSANSKEAGTKYGLFRIKLSQRGHAIVPLK